MKKIVIMLATVALSVTALVPAKAQDKVDASIGADFVSSYLELSAPFTLGGVDWSAAVGVVPFATDFYGTEKFALVNLSLTASKEIAVTDTLLHPRLRAGGRQPVHPGSLLRDRLHAAAVA